MLLNFGRKQALKKSALTQMECVDFFYFMLEMWTFMSNIK